MRSFSEKPGLRYSSLVTIRPGRPRVILASSTSGVRPISSTTDGASESRVDGGSGRSLTGAPPRAPPSGYPVEHTRRPVELARPSRRQRVVRMRVAIALVSAAVVAACATAGPATSLDRRSFLSTAVTENDAPRQLVDGTRIAIRFADGRISASAGCNSMGGPYRIDGGLLVIPDGLATTEMGCDAPRHAQDDWLAAFIASRPAVRLADSELALEGGGTVIRLLDREVADPDLPLAGTLWTVDSIITGDAVSSVPDGVVATLRFTGDGQVAIQTGCNEGGGRAAADATTIRFNEIVVTEMACAGPAGAMEIAVFAVVQTAAPVSYEIDAGTLTLLAGANGLILKGG